MKRTIIPVLASLVLASPAYADHSDGRLKLRPGQGFVLPCNASDFQVRNMAGKIIPESYGPYRAAGIHVVQASWGTSLMNESRKRTYIVRYWC